MHPSTFIYIEFQSVLSRSCIKTTQTTVNF